MKSIAGNIIFYFVFLAFFLSCSKMPYYKDLINERYKISENGVIHKFYSKQNLKPPINDDIMTMNLISYINNDSLFFNSYENSFPLEFSILESSFKGDFMSGLKILGIGDSASIWVPVDSLTRNGMPSIGDSGTFIHYRIKVLNIETKKENEIRKEISKDKQFKKEMEILTEYFSKKGVSPKSTSSGLHYVIHEKGNGPKAQGRKKVFVHYTGKLLTGETFDSSYERNEPISFILGIKQVIEGWDEGIFLLNVGDKASFYIPSKLAYGSKGAGKSIPPNSILHFDLELIKMY